MTDEPKNPPKGQVAARYDLQLLTEDPVLDLAEVRAELAHTLKAKARQMKCRIPVFAFQGSRATIVLVGHSPDSDVSQAMGRFLQSSRLWLSKNFRRAVWEKPPAWKLTRNLGKLDELVAQIAATFGDRAAQESAYAEHGLGSQDYEIRRVLQWIEPPQES